MQSLAELKALNAAEEAGVEVKPEQVELQDVVDDSEATEPEDESEAQAEDDGEEWLKADEPAAQAVPVAKHVEMKHKLRARLDEKDSELELLRKEIDALKSGVVPQVPQMAAIKVPKLSEYDFDEDAYAEAMADYQSKLIDAKLNGSLNNQRQAEAQAEANRRLETGLNEHYERAAKAREQVVGALVYPCIIAVFGTLTIIACLIWVITNFTEIFQDLGQILPAPTRFLIFLSEFLLKYGLLLIGLNVLWCSASSAGKRPPPDDLPGTNSCCAPPCSTASSAAPPTPISPAPCPICSSTEFPCCAPSTSSKTPPTTRCSKRKSARSRTG